jgi:hypothetical protein
MTFVANIQHRLLLSLALAGLLLLPPAAANADRSNSNNGNAYAYGRDDNKSNNGNAYAYGRKDKTDQGGLLTRGAPAPAPGLAFLAVSVAAGALLRRRARKGSQRRVSR